MEPEDEDIAYQRRRFCARWSRLKMVAVTVLVIAALVVAIVAPTLAFMSNTPHTSLKVAAFNVQTFGVSKMSDSTVAGRLVNIIKRSDLVLIQEVRDSSGQALNDLKSLLGSGWDYVASNPIGRTSYKEQYVFFYRTASVKIAGTYQWDDSAHDYYEREPYAIEIQYYSAGHGAFRFMALMGLHSRPDDTPSELTHLPGVIRAVANHFSSADGVIAMGDFNADCSYLNSDLRNNLPIFSGADDFHSVIGESADTTVSHSTNCAYDRVVTLGNVDVRNAHVYNFESALGLTEDAAKDVSDHYPVEFTLY